MENYFIAKMESYDSRKGEIYKLKIDSEEFEIFVKDGFLYYPKNFLVKNTHLIFNQFVILKHR